MHRLVHLDLLFCLLCRDAQADPFHDPAADVSGALDLGFLDDAEKVLTRRCCYLVSKFGLLSSASLRPQEPSVPRPCGLFSCADQVQSM